MKKTTVLLVDNECIVRLGVRTLLESTGGFRIIGEADDVNSAIRFSTKHKPQMVILDSCLPEYTGLRLVHFLCEHHPETLIFILTNDDDEDHFFETLEAGAHGYASKILGTEEILYGIQCIRNKERYYGPDISKRIIERYLRSRKTSTRRDKNKFKLTHREIEILKWIAGGYTNKKIAERLFISSRTVHNHRTNLMKKLDVHNAADLVRCAIQNDLF